MIRLKLLIILLLSIYTVRAQVYNNAESAEYDPVNDQWLVSNAANIIADDGQGNLSFFGNGQARTGMEVLNNVLFALDNPDLVGYDLVSGNEVMRLTIPNANFLNGLTTDGVDKLYFTDFTDRNIYQADVSDISNPSFIEFVANTIEAPNGIVYDQSNDRLIYVCWGGNAAIRAVDIATQNVTLIINSGLTNLDGIDDDSEGNYYVSSWNPARITKYNSDFSQSSVVPTPALNSPADIGYNKETDVIAIPTFANVIFYDNSSTTDISDVHEAISISPNPVSSKGTIHIDLSRFSEVTVELYNMQGKRIKTLSKDTNHQLNKSIPLSEHQLKRGTYVLKIKTEKETYSQKLVII